jgi:hypothetical protein
MELSTSPKLGTTLDAESSLHVMVLEDSDNMTDEDIKELSLLVIAVSVELDNEDTELKVLSVVDAPPEELVTSLREGSDNDGEDELEERSEDNEGAPMLQAEDVSNDEELDGISLDNDVRDEVKMTAPH